MLSKTETSTRTSDEAWSSAPLHLRSGKRRGTMYPRTQPIPGTKYLYGGYVRGINCCVMSMIPAVTGPADTYPWTKTFGGPRETTVYPVTDTRLG